VTRGNGGRAALFPEEQQRRRDALREYPLAEAAARLGLSYGALQTWVRRAARRGRPVEVFVTSDLGRTSPVRELTSRERKRANVRRRRAEHWEQLRACPVCHQKFPIVDLTLAQLEEQERLHFLTAHPGVEP
jgi:hypothetical protein